MCPPMRGTDKIDTFVSEQPYLKDHCPTKWEDAEFGCVNSEGTVFIDKDK